MDGGGLKKLMIVLQKLPLMLRVTVMHLLGLSEQSRHLDLRSNLTVSVLRSFIEPPAGGRSLEATQRMTLKDPGVKGKMWVSTYTAPAPPETSVRDVVVKMICDMASAGSTEQQPAFTVPDIRPVEAEWTGHRAGAAKDELPPAGMAPEKVYDEMMKECTQPTTVMYLHGGAYYLLDPSTHRRVNMGLARRTGGRSYSVRYRLAPQKLFPAALLDAFVSYLTLLYPPPEAYHDPVKPEHIVLAGDSAGGGLCFALLQLLLELQRSSTPVIWYGESRSVPLPAALASNSPWLDITHSSPRWQGEDPAPYDYLGKPAVWAKGKIIPSPIWPANPPREYIYAEDGLGLHPLVSPIMAPSWKGAPPVYICTGWEMIGYEDRCAASRLDEDGVPVVYEEYEAMPHCFAMVLPGAAVSERCIDSWAGFIAKAVEEPGSIMSKGIVIKAPSLDEVALELEDLKEPKDDEIWRRASSKSTTSRL
ncbi:Acetyl esterase/lipase [Geosmithia morbida]|uniref:Acetyl esterase/lipase n=1 Tax=Geosmithia morbida TaxID=1094350 RepID=A0A9P4YS55_9HYPO|nr:Acetyl esterase/lipase [Geosmithia morbida]KAF4122123.1 Acetyl esterase/lipase [Geosmithia morbida]